MTGRPQRHLVFATSGAPTLLATIAARPTSPRLTYAIRGGAVVLLTMLTAAAAQVSVPLPFTPVPFTMQPMVVLLGGAALGSRLGMLSQWLYLALGVAGLPVFAVSPMLPLGAARLLGPTGGYLISYPFAAWVTGRLAERGFDRRYVTTVLAMGCGLALVFGIGVLWLTVLSLPARGPLGAVRTALWAGLYPFLLLDILKLFLAAGILPAIWRLTGLGRARET